MSLCWTGPVPLFAAQGAPPDPPGHAGAAPLSQQEEQEEELLSLLRNVLHPLWEPPTAQNPSLRQSGGGHTFLQRALVSPHAPPHGLGSPAGSASTRGGSCSGCVTPKMLVPLSLPALSSQEMVLVWTSRPSFPHQWNFHPSISPHCPAPPPHSRAEGLQRLPQRKPGPD